jgi:uncharacterized protein (TIGR03067 family)
MLSSFKRKRLLFIAAAITAFMLSASLLTVLASWQQRERWLASASRLVIPAKVLEPPNLDGEWTLVEWHEGGRMKTLSAFDKRRGLVIDGQKFAFLTPSNRDLDRIHKGEPYNMTIRATTHPMEVDLRPEPRFGREDFRFLGILKSEGDILRICVAHERFGRPLDFVTLPESGQILGVFERVKETANSAP